MLDCTVDSIPHTDAERNGIALRGNGANTCLGGSSIVMPVPSEPQQLEHARQR